MNTLSKISFVATLIIASCLASTVDAQTRRGISLDALTPAGMQRVDVALPFHEDGTTALGFATQGEERPTLFIELLVASSASNATEAMDARITTISGQVAELEGIGERAVGDAQYVLFTRDNLFFVVRGANATEVSRSVDQLAARAPVGRPVVRSISVARPAQLPTGTAIPLEVVGAESARITADGGALCRATRAGYVLQRREGQPEAYSLSIVWVDALGRVGRTTR